MEQLLTTKKVAEYLDISPLTVRRKVKTGEIPSIKIGHQLRFDKQQIDRWLSHREVAKPLHILVVDDDPAIGRLFTQSLGGNGNKVSTSTNGVEALEFVTRKRFDLIFLDLLMPGIDGSELFIRMRDIDKHVTTAIMTDEVDTERLKRAMKKGPVLLMHKPLDGDDVLEALNSFTRSLEAKT